MISSSLQYRIAAEADLPQLLALQKNNLPQNLSEEEIATEGFVTVSHSLELLSAMNTPYGHTLAIDKERVVGYALVMTPEFAEDIPILRPMFKQIEQKSFEGQDLKEQAYFVMGQVCIAKGYRGQGLFKGMYTHLCHRMGDHFTFLITEIDRNNPRSLRAHEKFGFKELGSYRAESQTEWVLVIKDLQA